MDDCWNWTGALDRDGYGRDGRLRLAHRVVYEQVVGPIPPGLELDHLCRNRRCVRPDHLEPVTHAENVRRGQLAYTHCVNGHEYTEANTYISPPGHRGCRTCRAAAVRRYKQRKKAA